MRCVRAQARARLRREQNEPRHIHLRCRKLHHQPAERMPDQHRRCAQIACIENEGFGVILQPAQRELLQIRATFVMRQIGRMRFKARRFERFAESVERPAAAKRAVNENDRCGDGGLLHARARYR